MGDYWENLQMQWETLPTWGRIAVAGGLTLAVYIPYKYMTNAPRKSPYIKDFKKDMVYLYQFPRTKYVPNISPYCLKLETWLRMTDIPYENVECLALRSKEKTLPFVELNGVEYADSSFAIRNIQMVEHLPEERWGGPFFYRIFAYSFQRSFPVAKTCQLQAIGIGKHPINEQIGIGCDDLRAISRYLGAKHYFTGFKPTKVDACLFGVLANIVYAPYENDHVQVIRDECPNLIDYVERIKNRYWPDWGDVITTYTMDSNWKRRPRPSPR